MNAPRAAGLRVLGVDPGTRIAGYAIVDVLGPGRNRYIECGVLRASGVGERSIGERIFELAQSMEDVIEEFAPQAMAIECAFTQNNAQSALKLAEARGAFKYLAGLRGLAVHEYAPSRIKRVVTGRGGATKAEVSNRVRLLCGLERPPSVDAADALAIALCHAQCLLGAVTGGRL